ncbi:hypothetical protein ACQP10_38005 (plasmid) [Streptosporangium sandarakinum]|uniref:hypothetical protein n=1 Tax=Streptosporangium sandarakinum TaxID=1260955 RepID=UPI003D90EB06
MDQQTSSTGERVILLTCHGRWRHDLRAVSNPYANERSQLVIDLAPEAEWYLLAALGRFSDGTVTGKVETHPVHRVWVEVLQETLSDASALT